MKKAVTKAALTAGSVAFALSFMAAPMAFAGSSDNAQASACGAVHGAFADVNGNFGWLGPLGGTPGYHGAVGQEPGATGYNNSNTGCNQ